MTTFYHAKIVEIAFTFDESKWTVEQKRVADGFKFRMEPTSVCTKYKIVTSLSREDAIDRLREQLVKELSAFSCLKPVLACFSFQVSCFSTNGAYWEGSFPMNSELCPLIPAIIEIDDSFVG